jgi:hypothetical protein
MPAPSYAPSTSLDVGENEVALAKAACPFLRVLRMATAAVLVG